MLFSDGNDGVPLGTDSDAIGFKNVPGVRYGLNCIGVTRTGGAVVTNNTNWATAP